MPIVDVSCRLRASIVSPVDALPHHMHDGRSTARVHTTRSTPSDMHPSTCSRRSPQLHDLPMLRHVAEPLHARGLEADVGIEAAGDGAVDDGLLLLVQERDQLSLGVDVAPDAPVGVVEKADDGGLFGERWEWQVDSPSIVRDQIAKSPVRCLLMTSTSDRLAKHIGTRSKYVRHAQAQHKYDDRSIETHDAIDWSRDRRCQPLPRPAGCDTRRRPVARS